MGAARRRTKALQHSAAVAHRQARALHAWRSAAAAATARPATADAHFRSTRRRAALAAWRRQARRQALLARCGAVLAQKTSGMVLRAHLRAWLGATQRRSAVRGKAQHCLAVLCNRRLAGALHSWREWASARGARQQQLRTCLQRMLRWRMAAAWREKRARLERCVAVLRCAWWCCQLAVWVFGAQPLFHKLLHPAPSVSRHGGAARAWRAWQGAVALQRQKAARLQAAVRHWGCIATAAAFASWRQAAQQAKLLRGKAGCVVARMQHLHLARAMSAWRQAHSQQLAKRQVLQACVSRLQQGAAGRAFHNWRQAVAQRAELRAVGERCILRLGQLALSRAWNQVRRPVGQQKHLLTSSACYGLQLRQPPHCASPSPGLPCSGRPMWLTRRHGASWCKASRRSRAPARCAPAWPPGRACWRRRRACGPSCSACSTALPPAACSTGR